MQYASFINYIQIPKQVSKSICQDRFICFISTNSVFRATARLLIGTDQCDLCSIYGAMKATTKETILQNAANSGKGRLASILGLTKNVSTEATSFSKWVCQLSSRHQAYTSFQRLLYGTTSIPPALPT